MTNASVTCTRCGRALGGSPFPEDWAAMVNTVCRLCRHLESLDTITADHLRSWHWIQVHNSPGLQEIPRRLLLDADEDGIPNEIWDSLPEPLMEGLDRGEVPNIGLGLVGPVGTRKSGTLAWMAKYLHENRALLLAATTAGEEIHLFGKRTPALTVSWVDWPILYSELSRFVMETYEINAWVARCKMADVLVIDDLGAEAFSRKKDDRSTSFAHGLLANIIRQRNSDLRPIWWTSNVGRQLKDLYDPAVLSRLIECAPILKVPGTVRNYRVPEARIYGTSRSPEAVSEGSGPGRPSTASSPQDR